MLNTGHPPDRPLSAGRLETGIRATPLLATPVQVEKARTVLTSCAGFSIFENEGLVMNGFWQGKSPSVLGKDRMQSRKPSLTMMKLNHDQRVIRLSSGFEIKITA